MGRVRKHAAGPGCLAVIRSLFMHSITGGFRRVLYTGSLCRMCGVAICADAERAGLVGRSQLGRLKGG